MESGRYLPRPSWAVEPAPGHIFGSTPRPSPGRQSYFSVGFGKFSSIISRETRRAMEIDFVPKCLVARLPVPSSAHIHLSVFLSTVSVVALLSPLTHVPHICLVRWLFDVPCPGCGVTHAVLATAHFRLAAAWHSNPAGLAISTGFCYQLMARPIAMLFPRTGQFVVRTSGFLSRFVVGSIFAVWIARLA